MADRPAPLNVYAGDGTWVENRPSKWQQIRNILSPYVTEPVNAMQRLWNDPAVVYGFQPTEQTVADSLMLSGLVSGGSAFAPKPRNAMTMGVRAYHGSPHDFDRFSLNKIGTGEGAQVYGHGLYFAEDEAVARSYRDALSPKKVAIGGKMVDSPTFFKAARRSPSVDDNIKILTKQRENILKEMAEYTRGPELGDFVRELYETQLKDVDKEIAELSQYRGEWFGTRPGGSMYEVDINANPEAFLDWDKPMGEQLDVASKIPGWDFRVREWLRSKIGPDPRTLTGAQFLARTTTDPAKTSARLSEAGIPGVKYLDAGSRVPSAMAKKELAEWQSQLPVAERELADAIARGDKFLIGRKQAEVQRVKDGIARVSKEAQGTRNYVVFDDKLINIVRKYGIAGASAMLGYNLLENVSEAQAEELRRIERTEKKK